MKKFENFAAALKNLEDIFDYSEPYGNVEMTGLVGLFEVCFEQSWKAMKEFGKTACAALDASENLFYNKKKYAAG